MWGTYNLMFRLFRTHKTGLFIAVALFTAALFAFTSPGIGAAQADNQRVITIHDGETSFTVTTQAKTIGEVLDRTEVNLGEYDMVEPAKDTPLLSPAYTVNVYRARPVTIVDGAARTKVMSPYQSARSIVTGAKMDLYDEDVATKQRIDNFLSEGGPGLKVELDRATPVTLVLYGKQTQVRTQATTVGELLQEKSIILGSDDGISKTADVAISKGIVIDIYRDGVQTETKELPVPFETRTIQDANRDVGYREVQEAGKNGKRTVTYEIELKNGKEVNRKEIQSVVTARPKQEVVVVGAKRPAFAGDLEASFAALRQCESGGNYANKNNSLYRGAYQFGYGTWANRNGIYDPADAPPAVQDQAAYELYQRRGWQPWPACSQKLGL